MIYASHQHKTGTDLTRLTPDPDSFHCLWKGPSLQHPLLGDRGYPELGETAAGPGGRKRGPGAHSSPACLQQYQRPARQPGFPEEGASLPLLSDLGLSVTFSVFPIH